MAQNHNAISCVFWCHRIDKCTQIALSVDIICGICSIEFLYRTEKYFIFWHFQQLQIHLKWRISNGFNSSTFHIELMSVNYFIFIFHKTLVFIFELPSNFQHPIQICVVLIFYLIVSSIIFASCFNRIWMIQKNEGNKLMRTENGHYDYEQRAKKKVIALYSFTWVHYILWLRYKNQFFWLV